MATPLQVTDLISGSVDGSKNVAIGKDITFSVGSDGDMPDRDKLDEVWKAVRLMSERLTAVEARMSLLLIGMGIVLAAGVLGALIVLF